MDKTVFYDVSYGVYVVTTSYQNKNVGCIANSFCQITSVDNIVSISLNKQNYTNEAIKNTKKFALSIISEQTNSELIGKFGFYSSKDTDKFADFNYEILHDLPVIKENCCSYVVCEVFNVIDAGTHDIFLAKAVEGEKFNKNTPMTYSYYHNVVKGKAPKTAPTYIEEKPTSTQGKQYKCSVCGYVYDESKESVKFADLPDDWKCPLCGVPKSLFEEVK